MRAIRHPDYDPDTKANDIMLLQVTAGFHWFLHTLPQGLISEGKTDGAQEVCYILHKPTKTSHSVMQLEARISKRLLNKASQGKKLHDLK